MSESEEKLNNDVVRAPGVEDKHVPGGVGMLIPVYVMGKRYEVPETLTIMKAMEYAGFKFIRGCGCRGGICGACATVYRKAGDYRLRVGLACQTVVEPNMYLTQIPFYPANRATWISLTSRPVRRRYSSSIPSFSVALPVTSAPRPALWT